MSLRTKLFLLFGILILLFAGGLVLLHEAKERHFQTLAEARWRERSEAFDRFLEHWTEPLQIFVADNSTWDDLVQFLEGERTGWLPQVLNENALAPYHAHAVWIYRKDGTVFGARNVLYSPAVAELPVPIGPVIEKLKREKFCHFFAQTPLGLMEVRGASIQPWQDTARATPPRGYLLAGRLWGQEDLKEMSLFTGDTVTIEPIAADGRVQAGDATPALITLRRALLGLEANPVAQIVVRNDSLIVRDFDRLSRSLLYCLAGFALLVYLLLIFALQHWVIRPFRTISRSLQTEDPSLLASWARERGDYGHLARVIRTFFEQRHALVEEMHERRRAESTLREREEELRHALKLEAIGRLAGGVAHDFNNLLTIIIGYASMLPEQVAGELRKEGRMILTAAEKAAALTQQLLAFSRKQVLHPRVIDLNALVREMERLLRRTLGAQVQLRVDCAANPARIRADPTQIEQVIVNLAINARDAMERGGTLTIATKNTPRPERLEPEAAGAAVTLLVQDTGCGMDKVTQERIFEPFFTTKGPGRGTGLGLATVYGIVRQSGGAIAVESELGKGTVFLVEFAAEAAAVEPPQPALPPVQKSKELKRVLVVDDDTALLELICKVLASYHLTADCVANGQAGLRMLAEAEAPYDLLITDVVMPGMSGPDLALQARRSFPKLPVLLISGYAHEAVSGMPELREKVATLDKPFTPQALMRQLFALLAAAELPAVTRGAPAEPALAQESAAR